MHASAWSREPIPTKGTKINDELVGLVARAVPDTIAAVGAGVCPRGGSIRASLGAHHWESEMPNKYTHEQIAAHDDT